MKPARLLQLFSLLATLRFTATTPIEPRKHIEPFDSEKFHQNVAKWNNAKSLATTVVRILDNIRRGTHYWEGDRIIKLSRADFMHLVERYFGRASYPAFESVILPMFARMHQGLTLDGHGPLKYRYDTGNSGFSGSAYTSGDVISFANQALVHHPFVHTLPQRARVWVHEMAHLSWVNADSGVRDVPTDSIEYSTEGLKKASKSLGSIYGETLSQYLALCYPNEAIFNNDNIARFTIAVLETAVHGHKPKAAKFEHKCPASQGRRPLFNLRNLPSLSPDIDTEHLPSTITIKPMPTAQATGAPIQAVNRIAMPHHPDGPVDPSWLDPSWSATYQAAVPTPTQLAEKVGIPHIYDGPVDPSWLATYQAAAPTPTQLAEKVGIPHPLDGPLAPFPPITPTVPTTKRVVS